jgi:PKD repeat protein
MRKFKLLFFAVILNFLFAGSLIAQLSYGGKPVSFNQKIALQKSVQTVTMQPINVALLKAEDLANENNKDIPWRFGKNIDVNINMETSGTWDLLPNGDKLWRIRIYSQGALTMNFKFSKYTLPDGATLFLYNEDHSEVLGSFTSANNQASGIFATTLIPGETITLEYYEPANAAFSGELIIDRVTHGYQNVFDFAAKGFGTSGSCERNVACNPDSVGWSKQIRSACMLVVGGSGFCSGALINNTSNNGTPYVLTANHCSTSNDFASWVFWFNWQSAGCVNTTNPAHDQVTTTGSALKARNAGSDFCLVQMNATPPCTFNPYYSGWSRSTTPATSAACIHHPDGDVKKISLSSQAAVSATYSSATCWQIFWTVGSTCTEPGSSGSPVYDQNHRIIGQLYGGPSSCGAAASSMNDYFGQVAASWAGGGTSATRLSDWLDPLGTAPQFIDGYDPCLPTATLDAELNSITIPVATYCSAQSIIPTVVIKNNGTTTLTTLTVRYNIDGGTNITQAWTGSLATSAIATVTFPAITLAMGTHAFNASCTSPNGGTDLNLTNDTKTISYTVSTGQALPFTEDFEATTFPPTNWTLNNTDGGVTWVRKATTGNGTSTASASVDFFNYNSAGQTDELITPSLLFPIGAIQMTFNVAYRQYQTEADGLQIYISTDCGVTYNATPIYDKSGAALATTTASTTAFTPNTATQWRMETVDLSAYSNNSVKLKFVSINAFGNNLHIDDINIQSLSTPPVADFTSAIASSCSGGVQFTDISTNIPTSWLWDFGDGQTATTQNPNHNYMSNGTYTVTLTATNSFGSDQEIKTNLITINMPASPTPTNGVNCGAGTVNLGAAGLGTLNWFDSPSSTTVIGTGTAFTTPSISSTTTFYVESSTANYGASQNVPSPDITTGTNSNTTRYHIFTVTNPIKLVSVQVRTTIAGNRTVELRSSAGTVLQSLVVNIPTGTNRITLNWDIPAGTNYQIGLATTSTVNLFRHTTGLTYPYQIAGLISITANSSSTTYGFFYDWEVQPFNSCTSARIPVIATINTPAAVGLNISATATTICPGTSVTFTANPLNGGTTPIYQWKVNGVNTGINSATFTTTTLANNDIVTCVMTSNATCVTGSPVTSNAITITSTSTVPASISIISNSGTSLCAGQNSTFTAIPINGGTTPTYQWQINGVNAGPNSATVTTNALSNNDVITCIMTSSSTCATGSPATSNSVTVTVNPTVTPSITISSPNTTICPGDNVTALATPTNGGTTPVYQWQVNGVNAGPNSPTVSTTAFSNNDIITCILTSSEACVTSNTATSNSLTIIVSGTAPVASFTYTSNQLDFIFTNTSTGATSYLWDFGDGNTSTLQNPNHSYTASGLYIVTLTVTSNCGTNNVIQSVNAIGSEISINNSQIFVIIYPNPAKTNANIEISGVVSNEINIEITDILGRPVYLNKFNNASGITKVNLDFTNFEKGIYFVKVNADNKNRIVKFIHE